MRRIGRGRLKGFGGLFALVTMLTGVACGGSGNPVAPPPPPGPPVLTCPENRQASASQGQPPVVDFALPVAQNGQAPVNVTCTPGSGAPFAVGDTTVTCTATDALSRSATCSFTVSVSIVPRLSVTKFVAFGDSLTEGVTSRGATILQLNLPDSYPMKLQPMLSARYTDQQIDVLNEGCAGEYTDGSSANCPGGVKRLPGVLDRHAPDVLLLMHGANDLNNGRSITSAIGAIETMIGSARRRGIRVLVATLPPQNPAGRNGNGAEDLPEFNRRLARMARDEGAQVVDIFAHLGTHVGWIGIDGLHPTPAGYERIAEVWRDAIQAVFEVQPAPPGPPAPPTAIRLTRRR